MKLLHIAWYDHFSPSDNGWRSIKDLDEFTTPLLCESVGWLVKETPFLRVIVASRYAPDDNWEPLAARAMVVLKKATKKVTVLKTS